MKTISPVPVWKDGANVNATTFRLYVVHNNLTDIAQFYYELLAAGSPVASGNLTMTGTEYDDYNGNAYAWDWAADLLGLTII